MFTIIIQHGDFKWNEFNEASLREMSFDIFKCAI